MSNKQNLVSLNGSNYQEWKIKMESYLQAKGLWFTVVAEDETVKEVKESTLIARGHLTQWMEYRLAESCSEFGTAKAVWNKMKNEYEISELNTVIALRKQLDQLEISEKDDMQDQILNLETIQRRLKTSKAPVSDEELAARLINALPNSWDSFTKALRGRLTSPDLREIKRAILEESQIRAIEHLNEKTKSMSFLTERREKHVTRNNARKKVNDKIKCFNCGKMGHKQAECWHRKGYKQGAEPTTRNYSFFTSKERHQTDPEESFIVDSGASHHMINSEKWFTELRPIENFKINTAKDGETVTAKGIGNIKFHHYLGDGTQNIIQLSDVLFVPDLGQNLLSISQFSLKRVTTQFHETGCSLTNDKGETVLLGQKNENLYKINARKHDDKNALISEHKKEMDWHQILGHPSDSVLERMQKQGLIPSSGKSSKDCETCIQSKSTNLPFNKSHEPRTQFTGELIHSDIGGPISLPGRDGSKYYITFIDDFSRFTVTILLSSRKQTTEAVIYFLNFVKNQTGANIKRFRSDNAPEYLNSDLRTEYFERGIIKEETSPYTPEQNGRAERMNRTLCTLARSMLINSGLEETFWSDAILQATFIQNRILNSINEKTPFELWFNKKPNLKYIREFGSKVFITIPSHKRRKFTSQTETGILIGMDDLGYKVLLNTGKIVKTRNATFVDNQDPKQTNLEVQTENESSEDDEPVCSRINRKLIIDSADESEDTLDTCPEADSDASVEESFAVNPPREAKVKAIGAIKGYAQKAIALLTSAYSPEPNSLEEALNSFESKEWQQAIKDELDSLIQNETWTISTLPKGKKVISTRWVFKRKLNENGQIERYKARLVAKGYLQKEGTDFTNTYSPVTNIESIRVALAHALIQRMQIIQADVKTAFLNGIIKEDLYIEIPNTIGNNASKIGKLNKGLYGLKQAAKEWYDRFSQIMTHEGFKQCSIDQCSYTKGTHNNYILVIIYVDDCLIISPQRNLIDELLKNINKHVEIKCLGEPKWLLGMKIEVNHSDGKIHLDHSAKIAQMINKFEIMNAKEEEIPMQPGLSLKKAEHKEEDLSLPFRELIGSLLYTSNTIRPDITYATNYLSRFTDCYSREHWTHAKKILRYLKKTDDYGITYYSSKNQLEVYVDSDFASDINDRKSTTGYVIMYGGAPIIYKSRKQKTTALSTAEAEYIAASHVTREIQSLIQQFEEWKIEIKKPIIIYCDNQSALAMIQNQRSSEKVKHIDIKFHYVKQATKENLVKFEYVESENNISDIFTKALPKRRFELLRSKMNVKRTKENATHSLRGNVGICQSISSNNSCTDTINRIRSPNSDTQMISHIEYK